MIIVFDTNVIISAFISAGPAREVFEYAVQKHQVTISPYVLRELKDKLVKKLGFSLEDYKGVENIILGALSLLEEKKGWVAGFPDKKDLPILDLCVSAKADLLITRDKKILALGEVKYTKIIHPQDFWEIEKTTEKMEG